LVFLFCFLQRLFRRTRGYNLKMAGSEDVGDTQNALKSLLWVFDEAEKAQLRAMQNAAVFTPLPISRSDRFPRRKPKSKIPGGGGRVKGGTEARPFKRADP